MRLARDKAVDTRLFSVNFGSGDATNTLPAAYVFENLLKKHAPKLGDSPLIKEIVKEVERDVAALSKTEVEQEEKKREATIPGSLRAKARHACYEILLHISRTGFAVFRKDEEIREQFRLAVLHKTAAPVVVPDDDDAPITTAPNEEFATTVAATTTVDVPRAHDLTLPRRAGSDAGTSLSHRAVANRDTQVQQSSGGQSGSCGISSTRRNPQPLAMISPIGRA